MEMDLTMANEQLAEIGNAKTALEKLTEVATDAQVRAADNLIKPAKTLVKIVHDQRMAVSRRVDAIKKQLIAKEWEITGELQTQIERVGSLCTAYLANKEAERAAAAERAAEEQRRLDDAARAESVLTGREVQAQTVAQVDAGGKPVDGVSSRCTWAFDIVDAAAVPRAYCVPDSALIRAYMMEAKKSGADIASLDIPGVKFRKDFRL